MRNVSVKLRKLLEEDPRFSLGAYAFVQEALQFAQRELQLGEVQPSDDAGESPEPDAAAAEPHLTGQQLCEAARQLALSQYGMLARHVLRNWGIRSTNDIGEIVYNLIRIGLFKKSKNDRREDFDDVFDFDEAFRYELTKN